MRPLVVHAAVCAVFLTEILRGTAGAPVASPKPQLQATVLAEFASVVEFVWPSPAARAAAIANGSYIPENCAISGIRFYAGDVYLTTPRWKPGVPSTLNKLVYAANGAPLLQPYPSWDMQTVGNYTALQNIQGLEVDSFGRMWILDVGRLNTMDTAAIVNGPPKLVIWDMATNTLDRTFVFANDVGPYDASDLQDLVVDEVNGFAYIADAAGSYGGAMVVYSYASNTAWRWHDASMAATPGYSFSTDGTTTTGTTAIDGIALSPDSETVYYTPLMSNRLYSVPAQALRSPSTSSAARSAQVTFLGTKTGPSGGMAAAGDGTVYFGALANSSVYAWDPAQPLTDRHVVATNATTLQWQDGLCFDDSGRLLVTSNNLQLYIQGTMTFDHPNFRVMAIDVGKSSYISAERQKTQQLAPRGCPPTPWWASSAFVVAQCVAVGLLAAALVACGVARGGCKASRRRNAPSSPRRYQQLPAQR